MVTATQIFPILAVALIAGVANALPPQKIVGGLQAAPGEFPYQVVLRVNGNFHCGGAIISSRHVITAAHCVATLSEYPTVGTGSVSITGGQSHSVEKVFYHHGYDSRDPRSPNDLAIIFLTADIPFNKYQHAIALPNAPTPPGVITTVSGWGSQEAFVPVTSILLKIDLRTISGIQCQQMLIKTGIVYNNQICTYNRPGHGTCMGDSGGPLTYNGQLVGVVSYGQPCAIGYPDVFTSIYHHLSWIHQVLNN